MLVHTNIKLKMKLVIVLWMFQLKTFETVVLFSGKHSVLTWPDIKFDLQALRMLYCINPADIHYLVKILNVSRVLRT